MRYYPQAQIDQLISHGQVKRERDRNDNERLMLCVTLPEPGGAKVYEDVRSLESATLSDYANDRRNPYLRAKFEGVVR